MPIQTTATKRAVPAEMSAKEINYTPYNYYRAKYLEKSRAKQRQSDFNEALFYKGTETTKRLLNSANTANVRGKR
jgi:hypothetical protein